MWFRTFSVDAGVLARAFDFSSQQQSPSWSKSKARARAPASTPIFCKITCSPFFTIHEIAKSPDHAILMTFSPSLRLK